MSGLPAWAGAYVGVPYRDRGRSRAGWDCYGLVWVIAREQFGVALPDYRYRSAADLADVRALVAGARTAGPWRPVTEADVRAGDIAVLRSWDGSPVHVGMMLAPGWMLHVHAGIDTVICNLGRRFLGLRWRDRLDAIGRHRDLAR